MNEGDFEWSEQKAAENMRKHKVSFEVARYVFDDPNALGEIDGGEHYGEDRYNIIGVIRGRLFFVTYTIRGNRCRLISARRAEPHEKKRYHEENR
jgi:uncharacterized DUF497 family protein